MKKLEALHRALHVHIYRRMCCIHAVQIHMFVGDSFFFHFSHRKKKTPCKSQIIKFQRAEQYQWVVLSIKPSTLFFFSAFCALQCWTKLKITKAEATKSEKLLSFHSHRRKVCNDKTISTIHQFCFHNNQRLASTMSFTFIYRIRKWKTVTEGEVKKKKKNNCNVVCSLITKSCYGFQIRKCRMPNSKIIPFLFFILFLRFGFPFSFLCTPFVCSLATKESEIS